MRFMGWLHLFFSCSGFSRDRLAVDVNMILPSTEKILCILIRMKTPIHWYVCHYVMIALVIVQLLIWQSAIAQQGTHTFIFNKQRQPLPFTNILSLKSGKGTITDEQGRFDRHIFPLGDSLAITNIAYQRVILRAEYIPDTLYLLPLEKTLPNLTIYNWDSFNKSESTGYTKRKSNHLYNFLPGSQYAVFIPSKKGISCWVQSVNFKFQSTGSCNGRMRIRLLSRNPENGKPGEDLVDDPGIFPISKIPKNWVVDFKEQHVIIPEEGMYVLIEVLDAEDACMPKGGIYGIEDLLLSSAITDKPGAGWRSFRDGEWYPLLGNIVPQVIVQYKYHQN